MVRRNVSRNRRHAFAALVACILVFPALPLAAGSADLALTFRGGVSRAHYAGADYEGWLAAGGYVNSGIHDGFVGGAGIAYGFTRFLAVQADLLYAGTGGFSNNGMVGIFHDDAINILQLPVTAVIRLRFTRLELYALGGPSASLRVGPVPYQSDAGDGTWPESQFSRFGFGYVFGGGINLYFRGGFFLSFDGRYYGGLTSAMNVDETGLDDWRQKSLQITTGIGILLMGETAKYWRSRYR